MYCGLNNFNCSDVLAAIHNEIGYKLVIGILRVAEALKTNII